MSDIQISEALDVLLAAARAAYSDSKAPAHAFRWSISADGAQLEIFRSPMDWRVIPFSAEQKGG